MKKTALLVLIGGRQVPNRLVAQYLKPDLIVPIASPEAMKDGTWSNIKPILEQLGDKLLLPKSINGFDVATIKDYCRKIVEENTDYEWFFHITCGTKVMSIGCYEIGKSVNANIWYLDTASKNVSVLNGNSPKDDLFKLTIEEYLKSYGRNIGKNPSPPETIALKNFINQMAQDSSEATEFQNVFMNSYKSGSISILSSKILDLFLIAEKANLIENFKLTSPNNYSFNLTPNLDSKCVTKFINGNWLELYVANILRDLKFFDDVDYGCEIIDGKAKNEIDVLVCHNATLLAAECKTSKNPFESKHLTKFNAIGTFIGGDFAVKAFITNQVVNSNDDGYKNFIEQAKVNKTVVLTGDNMKDWQTIIKKELENPTYTRK